MLGALNPMSDYVKPLRRRVSVGNPPARAAATRRRVLEVAGRRFLEQGYRECLPSNWIAADAGVSAKTESTTSSASKIGLLKSVVDVSFVADDGPVPLTERSGPQQVKAEPEPTTTDRDRRARGHR